MSVREIHGANVLVTGAARGIGRAVALELARRGAKLELVDLDEPGLKGVREEALARGALAVEFARVDVSDAAAVEELARRVLARTGAPDALINAAGVAVFGPVLDTDEELWRHVLEVNLLGTVRCTRAFAPSMVERGRGQIVNMASASAFCAVPGLGAYATTKYAVLGLSEALRIELAASGVGVSVICPGFVRTRLVETLRFTPSFGAARAAQLREQFSHMGSSPELVARAVVKALRGDRAVVPVTREGWGLYVLKRVAPGALSWFMARRAARP